MVIKFIKNFNATILCIDGLFVSVDQLKQKDFSRYWQTNEQDMCPSYRNINHVFVT